VDIKLFIMAHSPSRPYSTGNNWTTILSTLQGYSYPYSEQRRKPRGTHTISVLSIAYWSFRLFQRTQFRICTSSGVKGFRIMNC